MLRVLVISHSYIMKPYRRKFALIAENTNVNIRVICPNRWFESFQEIVFEPEPETYCEEFAYPIWFSGYGSRFFYRENIIPHFRDFQPDIIHLEEEAWSLNALQTIRLKNKYCPQSRFIFRTSLSVDIKQRFGFFPMWIEKKVFNHTDMAFPLSENGVNILRRRGYTKEVTVFPNGVDLRMFYKMKVEDLRSELGLDQTFVIGYVGRILRMKGLDTLVEAIAQLNMNCKILLVGRGEYRSELEKLADQLVISERIVWIDGVPPEDVPKYLNCMDTLVLPSRTTPDWVEFFGRVLVEAMACQVPVIGSDSGEIPNVIGNAGLTFPEGKAKLLADQIQMIAQDPVLRSNLLQLGLDRVEEFSWETIAQRTLEVYRDLV